MDYDKLIERLRTESLYKDKATLEIMDLCMEAAERLEQLMLEYHQRLELDGIACAYCAYYTDGCMQNDEEAEFCELWKWRGPKVGMVK